MSNLEKKQVPFSEVINRQSMTKAINNAIKEPKAAKRFIGGIVSAVTNTPALQKCEPKTIVASALLGEALGLNPSPQLGHFYLVPFKNRKTGTTGAQFVLGYKGYLQLALRSGEYKHINVAEVKKGEFISYDPFTEKIELEAIKDSVKREQAETVGYYAFFEYKNGFEKCLYWDKQRMEVHADKYSSAFSLKVKHQIERGEIPEKDMWQYSSFWYKDFDGMAMKTMLRQLISKWGIMSIDLQDASVAESDSEQEVNRVYEPDVVEATFTESEEPDVVDVEEMEPVSLSDLTED